MTPLLFAIAAAGSVYVNGVDVGDMRNQTFENATVFFDSSGDLHISAPGYQIQVVDPAAPAPAAPAPVAPVPQTQTVAQAATAPAPPAASPPAAGLPPGRWWLVTEDSGSSGHTVDVVVNGTVVQRINSGEPQLIFDLGPWLMAGANTVEMRANSVSPGGGALYLYIGTGQNDQGTVTMDTPEIQFGLGSSRQGPYSRSYTLQAN